MKSIVNKILQKSTTKSIGAVTLQRIFQAGIGFFSSLIVVRYLGAEQFGNLSYIMAVMFILTPFYSSGVDEFLLKDLVKEDEATTIWAGFYIKLLSFVIVTFSLVVYCLYINPFAERVILLYGLLMFFRTFDVFEVYMSAKTEFLLISKIKVAVSSFLFVLKLLCIWLKLGWRYFAIISALEIVLFSIGFFFYYIRKNPSFFKSFADVKIEKLKKYIKLSFPVLLILVVDFSLMRVDQIMVEHYTSRAELGVYSVGIKLIEVIKLIPLLFVTVLLPEIVKGLKKGHDIAMERTAYLYGIQTIFGLLVVGFVFLFGGNLISLLYGNGFSEADIVLKYYSLVMFFSVFSNARNKVLIVSSGSRVALFFSCFVLSVNIVLNIIFLKQYGAIGAIWASVASYFLGSVLFLVDKKFREASILPLIVMFRKCIQGMR